MSRLCRLGLFTEKSSVAHKELSSAHFTQRHNTSSEMMICVPTKAAKPLSFKDFFPLLCCFGIARGFKKPFSAIRRDDVVRVATAVAEKEKTKHVMPFRNFPSFGPHSRDSSSSLIYLFAAVTRSA